MPYLFSVLFLLLGSCHSASSPPTPSTPKPTITAENPQDHSIIQPNGATIATRFSPLSGYHRIPASNGYISYLRHLKLLPHESEVKYYNQETKSNFDVYAAVLDQDIGHKNLHQCADAIMRIQADYYFENQEFDKIHFNLTNGFRVDYNRWKEGYRVKVNGNTTSWYKATEADSSYATYWKYLEFVFTYAGTLSLSKELVPVPISDMQIGDVLIKGGAPGHAVLVIDMIENEKGEKAYLLAQSYMPAQTMQILLNPNNPQTTPWYELNDTPSIITPEWSFSADQLMRFKHD